MNLVRLIRALLHSPEPDEVVGDRELRRRAEERAKRIVEKTSTANWLAAQVEQAMRSAKDDR